MAIILATVAFAVCMALAGTTQAYAAESNVSRYGGEDRYETAVEISKKTFPGTADTVVLAYGGRFSDSLSGSGLAGITTASPLLTDIDTLPAVTATEITRLSPSKVYVLGGTAAISEGVTEQVRALPSKPEIVRLAGLDRYATARIIAEEIVALGGSTEEAYIACGASFADSAILSSFSASQTVPILLADDEGLSAEAAAFIEANAISDVTIAGGTAAVPSQTEAQLAQLGVSNVKRHGGTDRYDTCEKLVTALIDKYDLTVFLIGVAVGESDRFADALTGGTSAGIRGGVVVISPSNNSDFVTRVVITLSGGGKPRVEIYGKEGAVSTDVETDLGVVAPVPAWNDDFPRTYIGTKGGYIEVKDGKCYVHGGGNDFTSPKEIIYFHDQYGNYFSITNPMNKRTLAFYQELFDYCDFASMNGLAYTSGAAVFIDGKDATSFFASMAYYLTLMGDGRIFFPTSDMNGFANFFVFL
ncbi:MAG: cell wall-binding repeat-containing protein [Coriobacteriales bacterium]|nr:cell wall-binding repeat-containing protein [Coriobacteriales bacterium]